MHIAFRPAVLVTIAGLSVTALFGAAASAANGPDKRARLAEYPLQVLAVETTPKRPKAGKPFLAVAAIINEETAEPVSGEIRCPAKIGRRSVRVGFKHLDTGVAGCGWSIPRRSGGKRFVGSIEVTSDEGYTASIPLSKVIRP